MHEREIDEVVAEKKTIRGTVSFPHAELGSRVYDYIFSPVINENGEVEAIAGTTRDITEIRLAGEEIRQSGTRLKMMIDQTPAPTLILMGDDLVVEQINIPMLQMIGQREEIIGIPLIDIMPELKGQYAWEKVLQVYREGISFDQSEVLVSHMRNGIMEDFYYNIAYRPLKENDTITGMIQVAIDVTEQVISRKKIEESESRFRVLSDEMPQFVWTGDAEGNLGYFNQAVYKYSGLTEEETLNGGWIQIVHPDDREENIRLWQQSVATGEDFIFEHRFRQADGEYRWQLSRAVPQKDDQGIIRQWIGTSTDIQDQKNIKEELEKLVAVRTRELKRSNEDLQQFAHVASHDLKEPVRKIKTFTNRLEDHLSGKLDDSAQRFIERIHVASDRMSTMIDGVLKYSKINAGMQKPELISLNEITEDIRTDLEISLQNTGAVIHCSDLPRLEGARVLLYQLFYNLINNSIKFAKAGTTPRIDISSLVTDTEKQAAVITLKDNGIGFDQDYAEKIFETFTRLHSKDEYEGTGLGLALCKKIVERHGGNIVANSRKDEGTEFIITLPLEQRNRDI